MKNRGYSPYTMKNIIKNLKLLLREVGSLQDPERVRESGKKARIGFSLMLKIAY